MVDLLVGTPLASPIEARLRGCSLHTPAHFDAEVLSALGRLQRSGQMSVRQAPSRISRVASAPIERHLLTPLLEGAWRRRDNLRMVDALYVELAENLGATIVTTDAGLASASPAAELVSGRRSMCAVMCWWTFVFLALLGLAARVQSPHFCFRIANRTEPIVLPSESEDKNVPIADDHGRL